MSFLHDTKMKIFYINTKTVFHFYKTICTCIQLVCTSLNTKQKKRQGMIADAHIRKTEKTEMKNVLKMKIYKLSMVKKFKNNKQTKLGKGL